MSVAPNDRPQELRGDIWDVETADDAAAFDKGHDSLFGRGGLIGAAASLPAHVGFITFDGLAGAAKRRSEQVPVLPHSFPDAVSKEPSGLHAASEHALDLVSRDAFLAGAHEMDDLQPQMQREMRGFEDSSHPHGEGLFAGITLAQSGAGGLAVKSADPDAVSVLAMWANGTSRPQLGFDVIKGGGFILEMGGGKNGVGHGESS